MTPAEIKIRDLQQRLRSKQFEVDDLRRKIRYWTKRELVRTNATPSALMRGLPTTEPARRKEYHRRYCAWWRIIHPNYMRDYQREYRKLGRDK